VDQVTIFFDKDAVEKEVLKVTKKTLRIANEVRRKDAAAPPRPPLPAAPR
jgi:hypothetical protein